MAASDVHERIAPRSTRELLAELDSLMERMLALPVEDEPPPAPAISSDVPPPQPAPLTVTLTLLDPLEADHASIEPVPWTQGLFDLPDAVAPGTIDLPVASVGANEIIAPETEETIPREESELSSRDTEEIASCPRDESDEPIVTASTVEVTWAPVSDMADDGGVTSEIEVEPLEEAESPQLALEPALIGYAPLPPRPRRAVFFGPYVWMVRWNRRYDHATRLLGPLGRVLRSESVRGILGMVGLVLLAFAVGWILKVIWHWT